MKPGFDLYALDVPTGQIVLGTFANEHANRYVFVCTGSPPVVAASFARLIKSLLLELQCPAFWISAWAEPTSDNAIANAVVQKRVAEIARDRAAENWNIVSSEGLSVAQKQVDLNIDLTDQTGFAPAYFKGVVGNG